MIPGDEASATGEVDAPAAPVSPCAPEIAHAVDGVPIRAFGNEFLFKLTTEQIAGALVVGCAPVFAPPGPPDFGRIAAINAEFGIRLA
jgi:hypothetical protein